MSFSVPAAAASADLADFFPRGTLARRAGSDGGRGCSAGSSASSSISLDGSAALPCDDVVTVFGMFVVSSSAEGRRRIQWLSFEQGTAGVAPQISIRVLICALQSTSCGRRGGRRTRSADLARTTAFDVRPFALVVPCEANCGKLCSAASSDFSSYCLLSPGTAQRAARRPPLS